jgi:hypothetical protein
MIPLSTLSAEYSNKEVITYNGKRGYFFDEETGDKILQDLVEFHKLKNEKIPSLELKLKYQDYTLKLYRKDIEYGEKINRSCASSLKESEDLRKDETRYLRSQLDKKQVWFKANSTFFVLGIVVGGALSVGLAFGLQEAKKRGDI